MTRSFRALLFAAASVFVLAACQSKKEVSDDEVPAASEEITVTGARKSDRKMKDGPMRESAPEPSVMAPSAPPPSPVMSAPRPAEGATSDVLEGGASPVSPPVSSSRPALQSGTLTAGDYDDVLNPTLYQRYLDETTEDWEMSGKSLPYVDADQRIEVKVVDRLGKPVPFAKVQLATPGGKDMFHVTTGATGTVYLYPGFDALERGTRLRAGTDASKPNATAALNEDHLKKGGRLTLTLSSDAPKIQKMDVLLTLDATGSMSDEIGYLQAELASIFTRLETKYPGTDVRAGLIVYRDTGDEYVVRDFAFTDNFNTFRGNLAAQMADGGGDLPEAMDEAMAKGLGFGWREDAIKVNLLVADAPPHDQDINDTWESALHSRIKGIHVVPMAASGVDPTAEFMMRAMAQLTNGRYIFLTDDSGVGNPHAEPKVDCYIVTRLNGLVERTLVSLMTGTRVEPEGKDVIRTVGNYKAGVCKLQ